MSQIVRGLIGKALPFRSAEFSRLTDSPGYSTRDFFETLICGRVVIFAESPRSLHCEQLGIGWAKACEPCHWI